MELAVHNDGTWSLNKLHELEKMMLERIAETANPKGSDAAKERLYPSPLSNPPLEDNDEQLTEDWSEFVQPELAAQFESARDVVARDVAKMRKKRSKGMVHFNLTVPKAHADQWCSALNQARLVLHERHNLPDEEAADWPGEDTTPSSELPDSEGKWMALLQSEIYGVIMEFLVTRVLWLK